MFIVSLKIRFCQSGVHAMTKDSGSSVVVRFRSMCCQSMCNSENDDDHNHGNAGVVLNWHKRFDESSSSEQEKIPRITQRILKVLSDRRCLDRAEESGVDV